MTYRLFPIKKDKILVRFDNLADNFDEKAKSQIINVTKFAETLFYNVNGKRSKNIKVKELDLQGVNKKKNRKLKWYNEQKIDKDDKHDKVILKPMQLRTFEISYS